MGQEGAEHLRIHRFSGTDRGQSCLPARKKMTVSPVCYCLTLSSAVKHTVLLPQLA